MSLPLTPKQQMVARLLRVAEGLADSHPEASASLLQVVARLKRIGKDATMPEVVTRTLALVVENDVTLDGRFVDVLGHLCVQYGVPLAMHPILLIVVLLGGRRNPDRETEHGSQQLDVLLSVLLEDTNVSYAQALNTVAILARKQGLSATADMAVDLMRKHAAHQTPMAAQQAAVAESADLVERPSPEPGDDLGWVIKLMLTLASVATVIAVAGKLAGSLGELVAQLDSILGVLDGDA